MQAIETHYLPRTEKKPARVVAKCQASKVIVAWDENLDTEDNHDAAAQVLINKLGWHGAWIRGGKANGKGNAYICVEYRQRPQGSAYGYALRLIF